MEFFSRLFRHIFTSSRSTERYFNDAALERIEQAIAKSEETHSGQIRFIVETALAPLALYQGQSAQERALEVFSLFRVWDTADNNGVLIYLLMADHDFEIIADRNIHQKVGQAFWGSVCEEMETYLKKGQFEEGVLLGIERIHQALRKHFPAQTITPNELPDQPIII
jgi:uncharacterized membrane protein